MTPFSSAMAAELLVVIAILVGAAVITNGHAIFERIISLGAF